MILANGNKRLRLLDTCFIVIAFIYPLYFFPDKSSITLQFFLGFGSALIYTLLSTRGPGPQRRLIPLIESCHELFLSIFISFIVLSILSFVTYRPDMQFSRSINAIAFLSCLAYTLISRRYLFSHLIIPRDELDRVLSHSQRANDQLFIFSLTRSLKLKRYLDLILGVFLLIFSLPLMLVIYLCLFLRYFKNPIFTQKRLGQFHKEFVIYKFKTFWGDHGELSLLGAFLRKTSLDELPQIINILKGDMSFVGPRAEVLSRAHELGKSSELRHILPPGLTGYWQLSPHRPQPIKDNIGYDLYYIYTRSLLVDLIVILLTPFYAISDKE